METRHLDLKVPKGWAYCSTRELEMIAEEMIRAQMMASLSRFHPFDWTEIKTRLFFRFSGVEIVSTGFSPEVRGSQRGSALDEHSEALATNGTQEQGNMEDNQERSFRPPLTPPNSGGETATFVCRHPSLGKETFELQTWQVHSFMEQLAWLDATDGKGRALPMPKMMFPYPERVWVPWSQTKEWHIYYPWFEWCTPGGQLLDGMTWQTYRWINDWMEAYTATANQLVEARERIRGTGSADRSKATAGGNQVPVPMIAALARQERDIRVTVLSLVFGCPKWRIRLARITEVEWQVIMFWWSSMMQYLKEQYPKCFKSSDKKPRSRSKQQPLPIELYTRSMATLQKYLGGLTETEINGQTAHAILRHLNDMAVEAEEMEKIRRKHK